MTARAKIAIVGAGLMGAGIAEVFAAAGHAVAVHDNSPEVLGTLKARVTAIVSDLGAHASIVDGVTLAPSLEETVSGADIVIEAAAERLPVKQAIFSELVRLAPRRALLASNTSVIPIDRIAAGLDTRDRILGTHWWNPPYLVPLVEVIRTGDTAGAAIDAMVALLESVGKTPVRVEKDVPGFIGNRLQHALWREAVALVRDGVCDAATLDTVVKSSFGRRLAVLGPLENADLVGTDLLRDIQETILPALDRSAGPMPYVEDLVARGRLGFKTGEGFRKWNPAEQAELRVAVTRHLKKMAVEFDQPKSGGTKT